MTSLAYPISIIIEAMNEASNPEADVETAFSIALNASKLWVAEGVPAAATYFDARGKRAEKQEPEDDDEPFLELLDTSGGNRHQSDDDEDDGIVEEQDPNADFPSADVTADLEKAFDALQANPEELANQAHYMPLCETLDKFFSALNQMEDVQDLPNFKNAGVFTKQVEVMLHRPVFTRTGFIGVWRSILELHDTHVV